MGALFLVRHGESIGNVAREAFEGSGAEVIGIELRDADVALSPVGEGQAAAFGAWLADLPASERPTRAWSSPYVRARQTAELSLAQVAAPMCPLHFDERLRDRELGTLDRLTALGVQNRFPAEAERRRYLGKFYYRPPGGESWADVALRLRSFVSDVRDELREQVTLVVAHDAVILLMRYILEQWDEAALLDVARTRSVGNASITRLVYDSERRSWDVDLDNAQEHLVQHGSVRTAHEADHDVDPR